jgi:hypothetical protein
MNKIPEGSGAVNNPFSLESEGKPEKTHESLSVSKMGLKL